MGISMRLFVHTNFTYEGALMMVRRRVLVTAMASGEARSRLMGEPVRP